MNNIKVQVIMSTYNGERYIKKQLDSIIKQDMPVSLYIRDDGSTDGTLDIIKEYESLYDNISYIKGNNIGVVKSFFELFKDASDDADYIALADQDDIWFPDKISRAIKELSAKNQNKPLLYCAEQTLIDADDNELTVNMMTVHKRPGFGNAVVENIATGCTCVFNKSMLKLLKEYQPEYTIMHDWWIYMLASSMGEVIYDERPCMYYRQHGNNTMGSRTNYIEEFKERVKRYSANYGKLYRQLECFDKAGYSISNEDRYIKELILGYRKNFAVRIKCIFSRHIYRQRFMDNIIFKILFLTNHI